MTLCSPKCFSQSQGNPVITNQPTSPGQPAYTLLMKKLRFQGVSSIVKRLRGPVAMSFQGYSVSFSNLNQSILFDPRMLNFSFLIDSTLLYRATLAWWNNIGCHVRHHFEKFSAAELFSTECRKSQSKLNTLTNPKELIYWTNQISKQEPCSWREVIVILALILPLLWSDRRISGASFCRIVKAKPNFVRHSNEIKPF